MAVGALTVQGFNHQEEHSWLSTAWDWTTSTAEKVAHGTADAAKLLVTNPQHYYAVTADGMARGVAASVPALVGLVADAGNWAAGKITGGRFHYDGSAAAGASSAVNAAFDWAEDKTGTKVEIKENEQFLHGAANFSGSLAGPGVYGKGLKLAVEGVGLVAGRFGASAAEAATIAENTAATAAAQGAKTALQTAPDATMLETVGAPAITPAPAPQAATSFTASAAPKVETLDDAWAASAADGAKAREAARQAAQQPAAAQAAPNAAASPAAEFTKASESAATAAGKELSPMTAFRYAHGLSKNPEKLDFRLNWLIEGGYGPQADRMVSRMLARGIRRDEHEMIVDSARLKATEQGRAIIKKIDDAYTRRSNTSGFNIVGRASNQIDTLMSGASHIATAPAYMMNTLARSPGYAAWATARGAASEAGKMIWDTATFPVRGYMMIPGSFVKTEIGLGSGLKVGLQNPVKGAFDQVAHYARGYVGTAIYNNVPDLGLGRGAKKLTADGIRAGGQAVVNYGKDGNIMTQVATGLTGAAAGAFAGVISPAQAATPSVDGKTKTTAQTDNDPGILANLANMSMDHPFAAIGTALVGWNTLFGGGGIMDKAGYALGMALIFGLLDAFVSKERVHMIEQGLVDGVSEMSKGNISNGFARAAQGFVTPLQTNDAVVLMPGRDYQRRINHNQGPQLVPAF